MNDPQKHQNQPQTTLQTHQAEANPSAKPVTSKRKWYQKPLSKTLFWGFIWALLFAMLLPPEKMQLWYYSFLIGAVPATLAWDWFNIQTAFSTLLAASLNTIILLLPYFYFRATGLQMRWLYIALSCYGFINAALGFTIIISMKNIAHL